MNTLESGLLSGNFVITNSKLKARYGKKPFIFGDRQWSNLSDWVKREVDAPTFNMELLITRMAHKDCELRWKNQRVWMGYILDASRTDNYIVPSNKGEIEISKAPRIRARTYKQGISLQELTQILLDHRDKMVEWKKAEPEPEPEPEPVSFTANNDVFNFNTNSGSTQTIGNVLQNDNGENLTVISLDGRPLGSRRNGSNGGRISVTRDGDMTFVANNSIPNLDSNEELLTTITYEVRDGNGDTNEATVTIRVRNGGSQQPVTTTVVEPEPEPEPELVIEDNGELDDWETLED